MREDAATQATLWRLAAEDAVGQLRRRDGEMAALGSEGGALKLDWVEGVARLLADPVRLEAVETEARAMRARGIRHVIWAGMGGSVLAVRVLGDLGFGGDSDDTPAASQDAAAISLYPLDSTDPAALNGIVRAIAACKGLGLPEEQPPPAWLRALLGDVLLVGVAMGMTSEEPVTHLAWFAELLARAELPPSDHLLVMTLPGSYLDTFARERQATSLPLQLDGGTGTGGRMSAPSTRVFLLPAALYLTQRSGAPGQLRAMLRQAWTTHNLKLAAAHPERHPFVRLAAALSVASRDGACRLLLELPEGWRALVPWIEQLMEESLGKDGKGIVVFDEQTLNEGASGYTRESMLPVRVAADASQAASGGAGGPAFTLAQPSLASTEPHDRLAALAASFLGWQLCMALYGYLERSVFAGQPAVEDYKARARTLRTQPDPLATVARWQPSFRARRLTLLAPAGIIPTSDASAPEHPAAAFARILREARPGYLDMTINGEAPAAVWSLVEGHARAIANQALGMPLKLRRAPAAYHSTEQSEMDGPPSLVSLRVVARATEASLLGSYTSGFLHAQAVSTWQAMMEAGRICCLLVVDGTLADAGEPLAAFFAAAERALRAG